MSPFQSNLFLLAAMLLHNLAYPMSAGEGAQPAIFYTFYAAIFVTGVHLLSDRRSERWFSVAAGLAVWVSGMVSSYSPSESAVLAVYLTSLAYHCVIMLVLARYIFASSTVLTEVILAATSLYLIIGSGFTTLYGLLLWVQPHAFVSADGGAVQWQELLYYSYVTLTTLGYGDITPASFYAQAVASFEAVLGVLYTVVLLSRLVGLHGARRDNKPN